jgi:hypothetical protein
VALPPSEFGSLAGIAIIVACLTVNQLAYLIGVSVNRGERSLPRGQFNEEPGERSHNHVASEYKR